MEIKEIKFFKKNKTYKKGGSGIKPDLYWKCILLMTFSLIAVFLVFGWYLFSQMIKESDPVFMEVDERDTIRKERIDKALEYFKNREEKSFEILNNPAPVIDPSL